jgi:hypothetical protein
MKFAFTAYAEATLGCSLSQRSLTCLKSCPSLPEMAYLRVPPCHVRDFCAFSHVPRTSSALLIDVGKFLDIFISLRLMQQLVTN